MGKRRAAELDALYQAHPNSLVFARVADIYLAAGRIEPAADVCLRGIEQHPAYATGYFILAKCYAEQGQYCKAKAALERVTALDPDHIGALELLAELCEKAGDAQSAIRWLRALNSVDPLNLGVLERIARLEEGISGVSGAASVQTASTASLRPSEAGSGDTLADRMGMGDEAAGGPAGGDSAAADQGATSAGLPVHAREVHEAPQRKRRRVSAREQDVGRLIQEIETDSADAGRVQTSDQASSFSLRPGIATVTLAELYASQGVLDRSLDILKSLLSQHPGDEEIAARIRELEAKQSTKR